MTILYKLTTKPNCAIKMKRAQIFTFVLLFSISNILEGQVINFRIKKIQVFVKERTKNKISTWDFHKPNLITEIEIKNNTEDTLKFTFETPNCVLWFNVNNRREKLLLNFAYNNFLESESILPHSAKNLSLLWQIDPLFISGIPKNELIKHISKSYLTLDYGSYQLVSTRTTNILISKSR